MLHSYHNYHLPEIASQPLCDAIRCSQSRSFGTQTTQQIPTINTIIVFHSVVKSCLHTDSCPPSPPSAETMAFEEGTYVWIPDEEEKALPCKVSWCDGPGLIPRTSYHVFSSLCDPTPTVSCPPRLVGLPRHVSFETVPHSLFLNLSFLQP